jgi:O-antigen ligase
VVLPLLALVIHRWRGKGLGEEEDERPATNDQRPRLSWYEGALRDVRVQAALLILTGGTLALTQSRGALIGAAAGLGLLGWVYWPRLRAVTAVVGVVGVALLGVMLVSWWDSRPAQEASATQPISVYDDNFAVRVDTWKSALNGIREYPLTGVGLDGFRKLMPVRYPARSVPDSYDIGHAHNQFLQAILDLGLPGMAGYLAVWIAAGMMTMGRRAMERGPWAVGIAAALLASFVHGLTDVVVMVAKPGVVFWAMLALLAASWRLTGMDRESTLQR